ncbi:MAG: lysylphosphatidylglycerol synthase transmembrane domain-containing protein [Nitritalea sp.]
MGLVLPKRLKQSLQVALSLALAGWIFWLLYKDLDFSLITSALAELHRGWFIASILLSIYGFWLRAYRWKLLLNTDANTDSISTLNSFWALMIGYVTNLLLPRAGEVARCAAVNRLSGKPISQTLGTVVVERSLDLLFLLATIGIAFLLEAKLFLQLFADLVDLSTLAQSLRNNLPLLLAALAITLISVRILVKKYAASGWVNKLQQFTRQMLTGIQSIGKLEKPLIFWASSIGIWLSYYLTMYWVALAIPSTASLSASAVLLVMVMGSIGMVAPVQGGIGTFHALVAYILSVLGLELTEGKVFAVIIHGSQTLLVALLGLLAFGASLKILNAQATKKRGESF